MRISKFLKKFREMGSIQRHPGCDQPSKISAEVKEIIEEQMRADDETTATQLHKLVEELDLVTKYPCVQFFTVGLLSSRLDVSWKRVLPAYSRRQQAKAAGMGSAASF